ncbi:uncharacterized protein LOC129769624 [Toxorhynchites rutilus septentrionalis]|uniref:uncharacterized protein LOC129769624 n=1 Tax=Toxorhynchites rutilus septentrionalis TaxID=329112 RepID=UPI002479EAF4|nr:uncharacterized protein LOC129769624 [Toxorhynchites rutilus septentrionalis]
MAFLSVRLAAIATVRNANQNIGYNVQKISSDLLDRQIGSLARFSSVANKHRHNTHPSRLLLSATAVSHQHVNMAVPSRSLTIQEISRCLQMYSEDRRNVEKNPKTLQLKAGCAKPTVLMFAWLNAKQKHLSKYAKLYTDQGFDVVVAHLTPWQLLWPVKGSQLVAANIVKFIKNNDFKNGLIIHGFSAGAYLWGECLVHIARDLQNYQTVLDRVKGQVWDSAADITEVPVGVPRAMFPKNPKLQNALRKYMIYHMKTFHESATSHYIRSSQMFHTNLLRCAALFLVSKTDPVGTEVANGRVRDSWESNGVKCTFKCWDNSPHVGHYLKHKDEYVDLLFTHLRQLDLGGIKQTLRAKV